MVHIKIHKKCGGELEHAIISRCIEPWSTEEDIVTRTKICRRWQKTNTQSPNKAFINKYKPRKPSKPNAPNTNEKTNAINVVVLDTKLIIASKRQEEMILWKKNTKMRKQMNLIPEKTLNSEKILKVMELDIIINAYSNNIDLIYEVLDMNSSLPQVGTTDTSLKNILDAKLCGRKPVKGMRYTTGKASESVIMVENQEAKFNLDTGPYCKFVGKSYLTTIIQNWEEKLIPIQGVKFSSASESMKALGIIDLTWIFPHPSQFIRINVEFLELDNCTSNHLIIGTA
ncbi:hypothetical protein O181_004246 [Austropuccinia psidii MF-1]|uniref:Uncharacterized protein n=1 Tax=Austropuccinia psidii MF-1 TaxID=1389203 RepID=A0A9Q3GEV0_9BASI|nr:hypothetical protein [Austropuccinia psidii MF-1]